MSQEVYILSLPAFSRPIYIAENGGLTLKISKAKIFTSKLRLRLSKLVNKEYRWWDIIQHSKKTIFEARLKGK